MQISIAITNAPDQFRGVAYSALLFAEAALLKHHEISQIFFYRSGVLNATIHNELTQRWQRLNVPLKVCRTTAIEYNITEKLHEAFEYSTLTDYFHDVFKAHKNVVFAE